MYHSVLSVISKRQTRYSIPPPYSATASTMHTSPTTQTVAILVFSNPSAGAPAFSIALDKITGGIARVIAQQQNPPTYPSTVPKLGTIDARNAAKVTKAARVMSDTGTLGSFPLPAMVFSQMFRHDLIEPKYP